MADNCAFSSHIGEASEDLGNRCSVLLSYRGKRGFPSFLRVQGQRETREGRNGHRFVLAQESARFAPPMFSPDVLVGVRS